MKILELEERYRRLRDEWIEATHRISRIAADRNSSPEQVQAVRERADELKERARRSRLEFARALAADGMPVVQIAGRLGITLELVKDMLVTNGDSIIAD